MEVVDNSGPCVKVPVIETYFDFSGIIGGQSGCWRARLQSRHGIHDAGATQEEAVQSWLRLAVTFDLSGNKADYEIIEIKPVNVGSRHWIANTPGSQCGTRSYTGKFATFGCTRKVGR